MKTSIHSITPDLEHGVQFVSPGSWLGNQQCGQFIPSRTTQTGIHDTHGLAVISNNGNEVGPRLRFLLRPLRLKEGQ